jgi:integrase
MRKNVSSSDDEAATAKKKYPIKHKRPKGQIIERGPNQFQVWLYSHRDIHGKPKRYQKTFKTLQEADNNLAEKISERNKGAFRAVTKESLYDLLQRYMSEVAPERMRPQTLSNRRFFLEYYVYPTLGHKQVRELTYTDFQALYKRLRDTVSARTGRKLSAGTVSVVHRTLRAAFAFYVRTRELNHNPLVLITVGSGKRNKLSTLTGQQVNEFLATLEQLRVEKPRHYSHRFGPMFHLAFETGMRPEEYLGLQWDDLQLDVESPYISIQRVAIRSTLNKGWWFDDTKTSKSRRLIPITVQLAAMLKEHRESQIKRIKRLGDKWRHNNLVFPNSYGEPQYPYRIRVAFKEVISKMGLDPRQYRVYDARHTMASLALTQNIHPKVVSERLGHSSITQTLDTYSHVIPSLQNEATQCLGGIIYGEKKEEQAEDSLPFVDLTEGDSHPY